MNPRFSRTIFRPTELWAAVLLTLALAWAPRMVNAQEVSASARLDSEPVALGPGLGDPAALDVKFWTARTDGLNLGLGMENLDDVFGLYAEYEFGLIDFVIRRTVGLFYVGVGGGLAFVDNRGDNVSLSAIVPVGLNFRFPVPLDLFIEGRPGVEVLVEPVAFGIGGQVGLRYVF